MTSKYEPLQNYLGMLPSATNEVTLKLVEIERILGESLPRSAFEYPAWWSNQHDTSNRPQAHSWMTARFRVDALLQDGPDPWVRFKRK